MRDRTPLLKWTAAAWGLYAVYEYLMHERILCSGECNIRIDLLLIYPLLLGLTFKALWALGCKLRVRRPNVRG
jgi:hypothetical protein